MIVNLQTKNFDEDVYSLALFGSSSSSTD